MSDEQTDPEFMSKVDAQLGVFRAAIVEEFGENATPDQIMASAFNLLATLWVLVEEMADSRVRDKERMVEFLKKAKAARGD